jgi:thioredoxin-like negative regulator of GroEL
MTPIVNGIEQQYSDRLALNRINANTGNGPQIMQDYRIIGHPTVLLFNRRGQEVHRLLGPQPADHLQNLVEQVLTE